MHMKRYTPFDLEKYLKSDVLLEKLKKYPNDAEFTSHKWLLDIPAKRLIYQDVYGEFLKSKNNLPAGKARKILDIGGGFCGLSRELIKNHKYTLVDILTHENHERIKKIESEIGKFWVNSDWSDFKPQGKYDIIIANDIFPNVDQRLEKFIKKFKPHTKKMVLTLTCYDLDKSYQVKRIDADEVFTIKPWTSSITSLVLKETFGKGAPVSKKTGNQSIFKNGRSVYKIII